MTRSTTTTSRTVAGPAPARRAPRAAAWLGAALLLVLTACAAPGPPAVTVAPRSLPSPGHARTGTASPSREASPRPAPRSAHRPSPSPTPAARKGGSSTVVRADFDAERPGAVDPATFGSAVGAVTQEPDAFDSMTYVRAGSGGVFVRTHLAAGTILGSNSTPGDGNVLVVALPDQSRDSACVSYDVRFAGGFDFAAGGKLPGLLGVAPGVSPGTPTGGGSTEHGWSGRVMWLGPSVSRPVRDSGRDNLALSYLYHARQGGTYGDDLYWGRGFSRGLWHRVRQCYTLNTPRRPDGVLRAWLDGVQVLHRTDVLYRTDRAVHITHLDWSVFRGGNTPDWASRTAGDIDLDNVVVTVS